MDQTNVLWHKEPSQWTTTNFIQKILLFFSRTSTKATNTRHNENYLSEKDRRIRKETRSITYVLNVYKYVIQLLKPVGKLKVSLLYSFLILVLYIFILLLYCTTNWNHIIRMSFFEDPRVCGERQIFSYVVKTFSPVILHNVTIIYIWCPNWTFHAR